MTWQIQFDVFLSHNGKDKPTVREIASALEGIRTNKIPFFQSWASWPLILSSVIIVAVGAGLTVSPLAGALGFVQLPPLYWLLLAMILVCYVVLTQLIKTWFYRRFGE